MFLNLKRVGLKIQTKGYNDAGMVYWTFFQNLHVLLVLGAINIKLIIIQILISSLAKNNPAVNGQLQVCKSRKQIMDIYPECVLFVFWKNQNTP